MSTRPSVDLPADPCAALREALLSGDQPDWAAVHLETCASCQELWEPPLRALLVDAVRNDSTELDLATLLSQVQADQQADQGWLGRLRGMSTPTRVAVALLAVAGVAAFNLAHHTRADLAVYPAPRLIGSTLALAVLIGLGVAGSLRGLQHTAPPPRRLLSLLLLSVMLPIALSVGPAAHAAHPLSQAADGDFIKRALACFFFGVGMGVPVLIVMLGLDRNRQRSSEALWSAGAAAGLSGVLALHFHCPLVAPDHLLAGHAGVALCVMLTWAGLGGWLANRGAPKAR